ncbi:MAG: ABC transporter permease [Lachnospiraceae bacterium]|nr:ABC transporter permease [Lachnospiraceae bacterium]MDY5520448.1 ABC transporter permease [Agathobacter sp.]
MLLKSLGKDLKRKKTMNIILLLFIILATMFVASGVNNVVTVMSGTDYYFDLAGIGDYVVITMGDNAIGALDPILEDEPAVENYRLENVIYAAEKNFTAQGEKVKTKNSVIIQSIGGSRIKFFDTDNREVPDITKGHAYVSGNFMEENHLECGDTIRIQHGAVDMTLVLDGKVKDALLGSDMMGNTRFILSDADMQTLEADETLSLHYAGQICYIDTEDPSTLAAALADASNIAFDSGRSTIKMCYVMDMIVAFMTLVLSVCLIIVSFVVLRFTISFTIVEEYREIGVMKAIGIPNIQIRSLYIGKYLMVAVVGAGIGFFISIPFGAMLLKSVSENMVLGNSHGYWINLMGALLVVFVIVLFAYLCTGKVKKASPVDAIRSGQTGERYKKKSIYRIGKSHFSPSLYMAVNDIVSSTRRFLTIILSFSICTLLVLMIVNTTQTMKSPNLVKTFGTASDVYVTDVQEVMEYMSGHTKEDMEARLDELAEMLGKNGMPSEVCIELQYKYKLTFEGEVYNLTCQQGLHTRATDYEYYEGEMPQNGNEIAITPQISELTGAKIGDYVTIDYGDQTRECMVTAYFQTMNQLGEIVRLHETAPTDFTHIASAFSYQINFADQPNEEELADRIARIKALFDTEKVFDQTAYCVDCIGVVDTMEAVQWLLLAITIVVVMLVTILMGRSFIADEKAQIAMLKAIGFRDGTIVCWQVCRFGLAALIAVILAAVLSIPMTKLCITPIFGMMGASRIKYNIDVLQIFALYPGTILLVTVVVAWLTALYTRTIKSSDTANIE